MGEGRGFGLVATMLFAIAVAMPPRALPDAVTIQLPPLSEQESSRIGHDAGPGPRLIGVGRAIPEHGAMVWQKIAGGRQTTRVRLISPGALGLRVSVHIQPLPEAASLRFFAPGAARGATLAGATITGSLQRNLAAGATGEAAARYWSPLIAGDALMLEIELPASVNPEAVKIALPRLSHFVQLPLSTVDPNGAADEDCHEDVACHPAWNQPSRATAILLHTGTDGSSGVCTGTLLDDADPATQIPYFLTAHHCVPDQTRASSLETYWLYRSRACGGSVADAQAVTGGADLLYTARPTDTSFLRLRRAPPAGVVFAGWQAASPAMGTVVAGVHHPLGQPQRIAVGALSESMSCLAVEDCGADPDAMVEHFLRVTWAQGVTAGGSSGSGLFLVSGELVGTLFGGYSGCDNPNGPDDYGRFDLAYRAALHRWLTS